MKKGYNITIIVIICIMLIFSITLAIVIKKNAKDDEFRVLKPNKYNSYTRATIFEKDMASIYLIDFYKYIYNDIEKAYSLLDENFRQTKFPTLNLFKEYIKNLNFTVLVQSYKVEVVDNNYVFHITANPNVNFIFRTTGVMQYTVEIK